MPRAVRGSDVKQAALTGGYERPPTSRGHFESRGPERRPYGGQIGRAKTKKVGQKGVSGLLMNVV